VKEKIDLSDRPIGVLIGIFSISSLLIRPFVGRALLKTPERNFMVTGALFFSFTSMAYLLASSLLSFLIVRVFQGTGLGPVIAGIILRLTNNQIMFLFLALTGLINFCYFYFFIRPTTSSLQSPLKRPELLHSMESVDFH